MGIFMKLLTKLIGIIAVLLSLHANAKVLIFDLNGVLIEKSSMKIGWQLSTLDLISYSISAPTSKADLEKRYREFLNLMASKDPENLRGKFQGEQLPYIMNEWLRGKKTAQDVIDFMNKFIKDYEPFFLSKTEISIVKQINDLMLPSKLVKIMAPIQPMLKLVQECSKMVDKDGKPLHDLFIISNWDKESFDLVKQQHAKVFASFKPEQIIISGHVNLIKPEAELFEYVIKKFKLNAKDCIFIDDQIENTQAAEKLGITGVHHKNADDTREQLTKLGIFNKTDDTVKKPSQHNEPPKQNKK